MKEIDRGARKILIAVAGGLGDNSMHINMFELFRAAHAVRNCYGGAFGIMRLFDRKYKPWGYLFAAEAIRTGDA